MFFYCTIPYLNIQYSSNVPGVYNFHLARVESPILSYTIERKKSSQLFLIAFLSNFTFVFDAISFSLYVLNHNVIAFSHILFTLSSA